MAAGLPMRRQSPPQPVTTPWSTSAPNETATSRPTSRNSILRFDTSSVGTLRATQQWELSSVLPATGANAGIEGLTWIPDDVFVAMGLRDAIGQGLRACGLPRPWEGPLRGRPRTERDTVCSRASRRWRSCTRRVDGKRTEHGDGGRLECGASGVVGRLRQHVRRSRCRVATIGRFVRTLCDRPASTGNGVAEQRRFRFGTKLRRRHDGRDLGRRRRVGRSCAPRVDAGMHGDREHRD